MPKSKVRKKPTYSSQLAAAGIPIAGKVEKPTSTWYVVVMVVLLVLGLAYIVTYYLAGESVPMMNNIGGWNFIIGFVPMIAGLMMAVRWK